MTMPKKYRTKNSVTTMKRVIYYRLAQMRRWANTERGERAIVRCLTAMCVVMAADTALLVIGIIME